MARGVSACHFEKKMLQESSGQRLGMLLAILQCRGQPPPQNYLAPYFQEKLDEEQGGASLYIVFLKLLENIKFKKNVLLHLNVSFTIWIPSSLYKHMKT